MTTHTQGAELDWAEARPATLEFEPRDMNPGTLCRVCRWPMVEGGSCVPVRFVAPGRRWPPVPYGREPWSRGVGTWPPEACPGCGAERGAFHHHRCPEAQCPRCGGRLRGCGCWDRARLLRTPLRLVRPEPRPVLPAESPGATQAARSPDGHASGVDQQAVG